MVILALSDPTLTVRDIRIGIPHTEGRSVMHGKDGTALASCQGLINDKHTGHTNSWLLGYGVCPATCPVIQDNVL